MRFLQIATLVALVASSSAIVLPHEDIIHHDSISRSGQSHHYQHEHLHPHLAGVQTRGLGQDLKNKGEDVEEDLKGRIEGLIDVIHEAADLLVLVGGRFFVATA